MSSVSPHLEDLVGGGVLVDALTALLLVHMVGHTDLLPEAENKALFVCGDVRVNIKL